MSGANPATTQVEVWRRTVGGAPIRIHIDTDPLTNNQDTSGMFRDYWAPLEQVLEYRIVAFGDEGQSDDAAQWVA